MKSILLIAGHWNIETITAKGLRRWRAYSELRKSTGASGERNWIWEQLIPLLRDKLIAAGVQVYITDAIYHEETYSRDYDLCLALHYDAGGTDSRCIISKPNLSQDPPYLFPEASQKADQFISDWLAVYPQMTGIASRQDRITDGMTDYYAWDYVKEGTPSVIIEHGNNTCIDDSRKMMNQTEMIAEADVEAVKRFFGISVPEEPENPPEQPTEPQGPDNAGNEVTIKSYQDFVCDLQEKLRTDSKDFAVLLGKAEANRIGAQNYKAFLKKVAEKVKCTSEDEADVLEALQELLDSASADVFEIKKKKLMDFSARDLFIGWLYKILPGK